MPIVVPCSGCPATLSAPESAAGKRIRCPKCKAIAAVPALIAAEEVAVVEAKVSAPPKPRVKPAVADEDDRPRRKKRRPADEDDEDDEDEPRRRAAKGGGGAVTVVLAVVAGLLVLVALGVGAYYLAGKRGGRAGGGGGVFAKTAPPPAGWKQYDYPSSGFKAYFPGEPAAAGANMQGGGPAGDPDIPQLESAFTYRTAGAGPRVVVQVTRYRTPLSRAYRDAMTRDGEDRYAGDAPKRVRWLGADAVEAVAGGTRVRIVAAERAVIIAQISGPGGARAKPEEEDAFFDNFELTK